MQENSTLFSKCPLRTDIPRVLLGQLCPRGGLSLFRLGKSTMWVDSCIVWLERLALFQMFPAVVLKYPAWLYMKQFSPYSSAWPLTCCTFLWLAGGSVFTSNHFQILRLMQVCALFHLMRFSWEGSCMMLFSISWSNKLSIIFSSTFQFVFVHLYIYSWARVSTTMKTPYLTLVFLDWCYKLYQFSLYIDFRCTPEVCIEI